MWNFFKLLNVKFLEETLMPDYAAVYDLGKYGKKEIRFIKAQKAYLLIWEGYLFCPGLNGVNPIIKGDRLAALDSKGDIWIGRYEN